MSVTDSLSVNEPLIIAAMARRSALIDTARTTPVPAPNVDARAPATTPPRSILSDITIEYGPQDLLGRFFLAAETAARARGIFLSFAPLEDLVAVNRANPETWRPLLPLFDPAVSGVTPSTGFAMLGRNIAGEIVVTQAARLYHWHTTSFRREAESLKVFYADPERSARPGERVPITAPTADKIFGSVVFSGAVWFRPDFRGKWLTGILPRLSRALAYTRWSSDVTMTIMAEPLVHAGTAERAGYTAIDWDLTLINTAVGTNIRCAVLSMRTDEMLADLADFMLRPEAQIDPVVHQRRA